VTDQSYDASFQIVWFKRDFRVYDHEPLYQACLRGKVIGIYIFEPDLVSSVEFDRSHFDFIRTSLIELQTNLRKLGSELLVFYGEATSCLETLWIMFHFNHLWSHEETGNNITFQRDLRVIEWCKKRSVSWQEPRPFGVIRRLRSRDEWGDKWEASMLEPIRPIPQFRFPLTAHDKSMISRWTSIPSDKEIPCKGFPKPEALQAGEHQAQTMLDSFLNARAINYSFGMSSPVSAFHSCSRLSPYLAWGNISLRHVYQATRNKLSDLTDQREFGIPVDQRWFRSIHGFESRLRWHCHFIQKLESEPAIEFQNMMRAFDGMREAEFNDGYFKAWCLGQTGYPMIDASMRALHRGGWINFRMRAMLISFATYQLWLHWRKPAMFLARHFLDFEPGIHFSQVQMQAGTTGINTIRIYSPVKQTVDQDPEGRFIRAYIPELRHIPNEFLSEPHKMPLELQKSHGCIIGSDYPAPIVEHKVAFKLAKERYAAFKKSLSTDISEQKLKVLRRHTNSKPGSP
jgi:deoxyribodipyrimidine photo-lyase